MLAGLCQRSCAEKLFALIIEYGPILITLRILKCNEYILRLVDVFDVCIKKFTYENIDVLSRQLDWNICDHQPWKETAGFILMLFLVRMPSCITNLEQLTSLLVKVRPVNAIHLAIAASHVIKTPGNIPEILKLLKEEDYYAFIRFMDAKFEIKIRANCRLAFLGASLRPQSSLYGLFTSPYYLTDESGRCRSDRNIIKRILDMAELCPYQDPEFPHYKEGKYTL